MTHDLSTLFSLADRADEALDNDIYEQQKEHDFDAPDDAEYTIRAATARKISVLLTEIERLRAESVRR